MHNPFRYFNSSPEVIRLAVMMYVRYPLSLRQVEDLLCERGIDICHETVRYWWNRFGPLFAAEIRKRRVRRRFYSLWRWYLDEVFVRINGKTHYLWRAVDHEGEVVEVFVTKRRDRRAAREFLTRAMKRYGRPASIVTDRLQSYRAAMKVIGNEECQETRRWLNNRAENSHQPFRRPGRGNGSVQRHQDPAEIHLRPCLDPQPFQPPAPSQSPRHFQTKPSRRPGRVASTCSLIVLDCRFFGSSLISLTMPGKGLRAAGRKAFRHRALVQRCQWHKRENVVSYLAKREQPVWRQRLQRAYNRPEYDEALAALQSLQHELEDRNQSAAGSLAEGLDETLTLHRLGVYGVLGRSLKTTNGLESINALIEERCAKVDHWQHSSQRQRWLATALLDIEPRLRKVMGYRHLPRLRDALKRELKIDTTTSKTKAA